MPSDAQICHWMTESSLNTAPQKRLWGETMTCPSVGQLRRDNFLKYNQSKQKLCLDIFKLIHDEEDSDDEFDD